MAGGDDAREPSSTVRPGTDSGHRAASEPGADRDRERIQTGARGSQAISRRAITDPNYSFIDEPIELGDDDRKTSKVDADHFRSLISVGGAIAVDTVSPPIQHEELASGGLIAEAIRQIKAGGRLDTESDRDTRESPPLAIPTDVAMPLEAPQALPVGTSPLDLIQTPDTDDGEPLARIALAPRDSSSHAKIERSSRPAIKMRAVTKPPANARQPTAKPIAYAPTKARMPKRRRFRLDAADADHADRSDVDLASPGQIDASNSRSSELDDSSHANRRAAASAAASHANRSGGDRARRPDLDPGRSGYARANARAVTEQIPRRSDTGLVIVLAVLVIGAVATAILILRF